MKRFHYVSFTIVALLTLSAHVFAVEVKRPFSQSKAKSAQFQQTASSVGTATFVTPITTNVSTFQSATPSNTKMFQAKSNLGLVTGGVIKNNQSQSGTISGQESFQKSPLIMNKIVPLQNQTITKLNPNLLDINKTIPLNKVPGKSQSSQLSGMKTLPLTTLPLKKLPPDSLWSTIPDLKIIPGIGKFSPKPSIIIPHPRPLPLVTIKPILPTKTLAMTLGTVTTNPVPRDGKKSEDYPLRAKLKMEKDVKDEQNKELSQILGSLEMLATVLGGATGLDMGKLQTALDAAKNGDFKALQDLINDPNTNQQVKDVLDAYLKAAQLLQDGKQVGPFDEQKLKELENALKKFPASPITNSLLATLDDINKWNEMAKKLADLPLDPDDIGLSAFMDILGLVQGALASIGAIGYGDNYDMIPDYGYGEGYVDPSTGYYPETAVPPAPPVATGSAILSNPEKTKVTMPFLLNGEKVEIPAGSYIELPMNQALEIKFDHGEGFGIAHYSLQSGLYEFSHTSQGWDLFKKSDADYSAMTAAAGTAN